MGAEGHLGKSGVLALWEQVLCLRTGPASDLEGWRISIFEYGIRKYMPLPLRDRIIYP
jgi:hypothetical protein